MCSEVSTATTKGVERKLLRNRSNPNGDFGFVLRRFEFDRTSVRRDDFLLQDVAGRRADPLGHVRSLWQCKDRLGGFAAEEVDRVLFARLAEHARSTLRRKPAFQ